MSVIVENLIKTFGSQNAVDNISFTAEKGKITGFLGPNGAGKSTTMKIITCYNPPSSGKVVVCGLDISKDSTIEIRKKIGYLPEHNPLYLDMYVHEYLNMVARLHNLSNVKERIVEMVALCGLTREQNKKIGQLSKGYRQRVGLAQALIHDPEVLILDEPTTGLDPNQLIEIRELIKNISKDKTVILSTHIMQEVQALCDQVVIINKGEIVANDKVSILTQTSEKTTTTLLSFENNINAEAFNSFSEEIKINQQSETILEISYDNTMDLRNKLIQFCVANNLPLVEVNSENKKSIEDVFRSVTS